MVMATLCVFSVIIACFTMTVNIAFATNNPLGFTLDLIHRDSPNSPFYDQSETQAERLQKSIRHFSNRISYFNNLINGVKPAEASPIMDVYTDGGQYIVNISIGTPPVQYMALADTGSAISWTQCHPCEQCFPQTAPIFDPNLSSTYKLVECDSDACEKIKQGGCARGQSRFCPYATGYGLNGTDHTSGLLATETLTLGSVVVPNIIFGCGTNNAAHFPNSRVSGLIGLDSGPASLASQLGNGRFSYCLVPRGNLTDNRSSKMMFGTDAVVTGGPWTPLISKKKTTAYLITLKSIQIGSDVIEVESSAKAGNMIVDTGTPYTTLPMDVYAKVQDSLARQIPLRRTADPAGFYNLCFQAWNDIVEPSFVLIFERMGLKLATYNYFTRVRDDITCFSFFPSEVSILGNMAQANYLVGVDRNAKTVSFTGTDCTK